MSFTFVQTQKRNASNPPFTSLDQAFDSNVTAGNLLVAKVWVYPDTLSVTMSDSQGNTWAAACAAVVNATTATRLRIFYAIAGASGACTVTATPSGNATPYAFVIEEFSASAAVLLDGAGATGTGTSANPSISITTLQANDLIVAMSVGSGGGFTPGGTYTDVATTNSLWYEGAEYNLDAGAAGSITVDFVEASSDWAVAAAAFKTVSPPTGVPRVFRPSNVVCLSPVYE